MRPKRDQVKAKAYDIHLADRMAFVQQASHRMQQAMNLEEVRDVPLPAVPFQMPWPKSLKSDVGFGIFELPGEKDLETVLCHEVVSENFNEGASDYDESDFGGGEDDDQDPEELLWRPPPGYVAEVDEYEVYSSDEDEAEVVMAPPIRAPHQVKSRRRSDPTPCQDRKRPKVVLDLVSPSPEPVKQLVKQTKQQRPRPPVLTLQPVHGVPSIQITGASPQPMPAITSKSAQATPLPHRPYSDIADRHETNMQSGLTHVQDTTSSKTSASFAFDGRVEAARVVRLASPPPPYLSPRLAFAHLNMPTYWSSNLSRLIYTWLLHENSRAAQGEVIDMTLAHVQTTMAQHYIGLHTPPPTPFILNRLDGRWQAEIKVTRMLLPDAAAFAFGRPGERDWLVIQSTDRLPNNSTTAIKDTMSAKASTQPLVDQTYWILAFPTKAITDVRTDQIFTGNGVIYRTRLMVGHQGFYPLLHGRNIPIPYFVDGFMHAFSQGEGMIQTMSIQPLPLT